MNSTLHVGVIGLGFMGRTHLSGYEAARQAGFPVRVAALADRSAERLSGNVDASGNIGMGGPLAIDPKSVKCYHDPEALIADPSIQLVSICTPTDTHVDLTLKALAAGKHVLVEKPLSLSIAECQRVVLAARSAKSRCMPAFCMRFWPGWSWLRERIERGTYGAVRSAVFARLGSPPTWSSEFYRDFSRSGGGLVDLHIHDADFVQWCFGKPDEVVSTGSTEHLTTLYRYRNGPLHVVAEGGWGHSPGFPFRMRFIVSFAQATAEFDSSRSEPLTLTHDGQTQSVPLESVTGWDLEIRHLIDAVLHPQRGLTAPIEAAHDVAVLLEAERRSLESGQIQPV